MLASLEGTAFEMVLDFCDKRRKYEYFVVLLLFLKRAAQMKCLRFINNVISLEKSLAWGQATLLLHPPITVLTLGNNTNAALIHTVSEL